MIQITEQEVTQLQTLNLVIYPPDKNPITSYYDNNHDEYIPYKTTLDNIILQHIHYPYFYDITNSSGKTWGMYMYTFHNAGLEMYVYTFHNAGVSYHVWDIINK